jgi:DNA-binding MarR family transcriptional regulator
MSTVSRPLRKSPARPVGTSESPQAAIGRLLKNMHQSVRHAIDESLRRERIDVSFAHFVTLYTLSSEPGIAGAELARRAFVTAQTMNTILRRMERDGAIERRPHPTNQRADSWHITKAGQSGMAKAQVVVERVWTQMFEGLSEQEVRQLQKLLERCLSGLDQQVGASRGAAAARKKRRTSE